MDEQNQPTELAPPPVSRDDDFASLYANQVVVKQSAWDVNLVFGELDQTDDSNVHTRLHTGITIPWPTAKVLSYLLQAHIIGYETENGTIIVPPNGQPLLPKLPESLGGTKTDDAFQKIRQLYYEWFSA